MQNLYEKYSQLTITEFALDDAFISWVKNPDETQNNFWNSFMAAHPQQSQTIAHARKLVLSLDSSIEKIPEEVKTSIWESVLDRAATSRVVPLNRRRIWMAAASIMILVAAGAVLLWNKTGTNEMAKTIEGPPVRNDVAPGGNKAVLSLANGATIILDSARNGTLTIEGNAKVIKLEDGRLAYEPSSSTAATAYNTITTPRGGQYQLVLADGSKVWLNAASSITFPTAFNGRERKVTITGEAYFEVAHNAAKPFHVLVNDPLKGSMDVQVLGTHFNINAYGDEELIRTTLLEGSVKVSRGNKSAVITPGEQAGVGSKVGSISIKESVDIEQVVAWKNGYFQFDNVTIQDIMRQLSRWYDVEVVYKGKIPEGHYVGKPSRELNLSKILKVIEYSGVHLEIQDNKIIVSE